MRRASLVLLAACLVLWSGVARADLKLGYIDSEALREKLSDFRTAQVQLERLHQQYESEATERKNKLDKLEEDFHKQELLISEARRAELKVQLDEQKKQLQDFTQKTFGADGELMKKNVELSGPIFEKINAAIQELAKEDGYDFIFDAASANSAIVTKRTAPNLAAQAASSSPRSATT
jgi:outer membrane protein